MFPIYFILLCRMWNMLKCKKKKFKWIYLQNMKISCKYFRWRFWFTVELVHQKTKSRNLVTRKFMRKRKVTCLIRIPEKLYLQCVGSRKVFPGTYKHRCIVTQALYYVWCTQNKTHIKFHFVKICIITLGIFLFASLANHPFWPTFN